MKRKECKHTSTEILKSERKKAKEERNKEIAIQPKNNYQNNDKNSISTNNYFESK